MSDGVRQPLRHAIISLPLVFALLCAPAPPSAAQVRQEPLEQTIRSHPQPSGESAERHTQGVVQRRPADQARTQPHASRVDQAPPDWEYTSPEEAEILEGWDQQPPPGAPRPSPESAAGEPSLLVKAWRLYARGSHAAAAEAFAAIMESSADRQEALNARLGLAYSLLKQDKRDPAIAHLSYLVGQEYRTPETRSALVDALIQAGRWPDAQAQIAQLPAGRRQLWEKRLMEARLLRDYRALPPAAGPLTLSRFLDSHAQALAGCIRPDAFHEIAKKLDLAGAMRQATGLRRQLLECPLPADLRLGILSELMNSLPEEEALALLREERPAWQQAAPHRAADLDALELQVLKRRLAAFPPESGAKARTAEQILALSPRDRDALSALAWDAFHRGEYAEAERRFSQLAAQDPADKDVALGLGYARLNSGKIDTALDPLASSGIREDAQTRELRALVYREQAARAYDAGEWDRAAACLERYLALEPGDLDAREMLAWTRYRQNRSAEARALMEESFAARPGPALAGGLIGIYNAAGDEDRAYGLAGRLAQDPDPGVRAAAGPFFFDRGAPITAAQLDRDPDRCYRNADSARAEAFFYHRSKDGSGTFARLEETALPLTFVYPTAPGIQWSAAVTPRHLAGNGGPANPQAGRYYRFLDGAAKRQDLEDGLFVVQPDLGFVLEGRLQLEAHVGTTPLNGPVDSTPTFEVRVSGPSWYADLHRCNVKDSILSYVGQRDPYSNDAWGRVTRNGIEAGKTLPLGGGWWASGSAGYDYYMGDSVWDNQAAHLDAALGQTLRLNADEFSYGLFITAQHFRRNSDFHTFGHGGYYSPELMTMVGPFVRYRTALCRNFWFDVQASAGWLHQRLDRSPFYPLFDGGTAGFSPEAAANAGAEYDSDVDNKIGFNLRLQGMQLITPHLAAGGFASLNNSADYTEWTAGVGIQIFFDPQKSFWTRKDMFGEFGRCSNK